MDTSQEKKDSLAAFLDRLDKLAKRHGAKSLRDVGALIDMSKSNVDLWKKKQEAGDDQWSVPEKWWENLRAAENGQRPSSLSHSDTGVLMEERDPFRTTPETVRTNTRFALPPKSPTREDVEAYVAAYLDKACQLPGGISHAYLELRSAWSMEKIDNLLEQQP